MNSNQLFTINCLGNKCNGCGKKWHINVSNQNLTFSLSNLTCQINDQVQYSQDYGVSKVKLNLAGNNTYCAVCRIFGLDSLDALCRQHGIFIPYEKINDGRNNLKDKWAFSSSSNVFVVPGNGKFTCIFSTLEGQTISLVFTLV